MTVSILTSYTVHVLVRCGNRFNYMRIGIDCRTILHPEAGEDRGIGHYTDQLVRHLIRLEVGSALWTESHEIVLFFDSRVGAIAEAQFGDNGVTVRRFPFIQYKMFLPVAYSHLLASAVIARERLDVFHAPSLHLPLSYFGACVVTAHDLAIYRHQELFPSGQFLSTRIVVPSTLRSARVIIAASNATRLEIMDLFDIEEEKIVVIPHGVDAFFLEEPSEEEQETILDSCGVTDPFFFSLGTLEPRKNFVRLVEAFDRAAPELADPIELVIAGREGFEAKKVLRAIASAKHRDRIRWIGYVQPHVERALLARCTAFVYPSLHEGFGMPLLHAAAQGALLIASRVGGIPEIANDAALYIEDPLDTAEIVRRLTQVSSVTNTERDQLRERAKARARTFSWHDTAAKTAQVYSRVV